MIIIYFVFLFPSSRAGKVKGLERFMGTLETQTQDLMETSSGQAKYEHQHKAIVWRVPRLPKQGQGKRKLNPFSLFYPTN